MSNSLTIQTREAKIYGIPARPYWPTAVLSYNNLQFKVTLTLVPVPSAPAGTVEQTLIKKIGPAPEFDFTNNGIRVSLSERSFEMIWGNGYTASVSGTILSNFISAATPSYDGGDGGLAPASWIGISIGAGLVLLAIIALVIHYHRNH